MDNTIQVGPTADKQMSESQLQQILNGDADRIDQYRELLNHDLNTIDNRLGTLCHRWEEQEAQKVELGNVDNSEKAPEAIITSIRGRFDKSTEQHEKLLENFKSKVNDIRNKLEILEKIL